MLLMGMADINDNFCTNGICFFISNLQYIDRVIDTLETANLHSENRVVCKLGTI